MSRVIPTTVPVIVDYKLDEPLFQEFHELKQPRTGYEHFVAEMYRRRMVPRMSRDKQYCWLGKVWRGEITIPEFKLNKVRYYSIARHEKKAYNAKFDEMMKNLDHDVDDVDDYVEIKKRPNLTMEDLDRELDAYMAESALVDHPDTEFEPA